ncbi:IS630 family transposase [Leptolyngbya sp. AN02str]|uniref:IS630 family transposase n=1 Tax=Leptolyngbya sp. AN02str TaxID=3423363 RepID=UPI003D3168D1
MAGSRYCALRAIVAAGGSNPQLQAVSAAIAAGTISQLESTALAADSQKKGYRWKRTRASHRGLQNPVENQQKQADLKLLQQAAREGHLKLKDLDESGFDCWSPVSYSWSFAGTQKRQEQTPRHGRRVNIIGVWEPHCKFAYGLVVGSITSATYIRFMNAQAKQAQRLLKRTGKMTVIVQDDAPIHTSQAVQQQIREWQKQGLYLFYLPRYSSELNPIEGEWHQVKAHQIRGRMFEDEYELAMGVIAGLQSRGEQTGCQVKRFRFNSKRRNKLSSTSST